MSAARAAVTCNFAGYARAAHEDVEHVNDRLVDVLALSANSFEAIDVDSDRLFAHIRETGGV